MEEQVSSGIASLLIMLHLLNVHVSREQIDHIIAYKEDESEEAKMLYLAKELKLKARLRDISYEEAKKFNQPFIAKGKDDKYFVVGRIQDDKVMVMMPDKKSPDVHTREEFEEMWSGRAVFLYHKGIVDKEAVFGFKWFIPTIMRFKKELITVLLAVFTIQILGILTPLMTQVVVDKVLVHNSLSTLYVLAVGLFIGYIFELILGLAKNYVFTHTTNRIDVILSFRLFKHLFSLPLRYFESRKVGETVARVRELDSIRTFLTGTPLSSMIDLLFIIVYIVVLFLYNPGLAWVVVASVPVFAVLSLVITPMFKKSLDEKFQAGAKSQSYLVESITGIQTVKSFAIEPKLLDRWGDLQSDYVKAGYKTSMIAATSNTLGQFIQRTFDLLILFLGAKLVMAGDFTIGQLVAFRMLAGRVSGPVLRFVQLWQEYQQASLSVKRIGDIFHTVPEPAVDTDKLAMPAIKGNIVFEKVRFRYRPDAPEALRNISFRIPAGQMIGIVGRSGSGKSTISKLIQRLYIPEGGKITVDGLDISVADPVWLRKQIGVVLQENFMFSGTVAENIAIHCPGANMERIMNAAKIAGAHEFIMELQEGYQTMIGEQGVGLSGGQKQRIAIARAIISNPRILILDEATSALDYESESIIQQNLKQICQGRTVLIIAHRLSTLKDVNAIMVVDKGELVEYDTPERLLERKGLYYYLHMKQLKGEQT